WLAHGDPNTRHHVPGMGSLLLPTFALAVLGAVLLLRRDRRDPWGRFAIYGFAVSPIPASLAWGAQHTLRLIAIPVFMALLAIPALQWLGEAEQGSRRRAALRWLILYFPGWRARVEGGGDLEARPATPAGLLDVVTPKGDQQVKIELTPGRAERWGQYVSAISLLIALALIFQGLFIRNAKAQ